MDHNIAAWMISGGPQVELQRSWREREQLHAFLESRSAPARAESVVSRIRQIVRPAPTPSVQLEPLCCPA